MFLAGPVRWEFQHTYAHWIEGSESHLPIWTSGIGLPILGLGPTSLATLLVQCLFWGLLWLGLLALSALLWRATTRDQLWEIYVVGSITYLGSVVLAVALVITALWLPFALL